MSSSDALGLRPLSVHDRGETFVADYHAWANRPFQTDHTRRATGALLDPDLKIAHLQRKVAILTDVLIERNAECVGLQEENETLRRILNGVLEEAAKGLKRLEVLEGFASRRKARTGYPRGLSVGRLRALREIRKYIEPRFDRLRKEIENA